MSMSFHKRLGLPFPGSAFLSKKCVLKKMPCPRYVGYVATFDTTLSGSRNGAIAFMVYHELLRVGEEQMKRRTAECLAVADYVVDRLNELRDTEARWEKELTFAAWRPPGVMCVNLPPPPKHLMRKYHMPLFSVAGKVQHTHILTMEHVGRREIDALIDEWDAHLLSQQRSGRPSLSRQSSSIAPPY